MWSQVTAILAFVCCTVAVESQAGNICAFDALARFEKTRSILDYARYRGTTSASASGNLVGPAPRGAVYEVAIEAIGQRLALVSRIGSEFGQPEGMSFVGREDHYYFEEGKLLRYEVVAGKPRLAELSTIGVSESRLSALALAEFQGALEGRFFCDEPLDVVEVLRGAADLAAREEVDAEGRKYVVLTGTTELGEVILRLAADRAYALQRMHIVRRLNEAIEAGPHLSGNPRPPSRKSWEYDLEVKTYLPAGEGFVAASGSRRIIGTLTDGRSIVEEAQFERRDFVPTSSGSEMGAELRPQLPDGFPVTLVDGSANGIAHEIRDGKIVVATDSGTFRRVEAAANKARTESQSQNLWWALATRPATIIALSMVALVVGGFVLVRRFRSTRPRSY